MPPFSQTRTSELLLPPSTGRSCKSATLQTEARGGQGRGGACNAAADDYQIIRATVFGGSGSPSALSAERGQRGRFVGRLESPVAGEQHRIAAALEAGQVVQCQLGLAADLHRAAILPVPLGALGAEGRCRAACRSPALELARRARRFPGGDPVAGADPHAIAPAAGNRTVVSASRTGTPRPWASR